MNYLINDNMSGELIKIGEIETCFDAVAYINKYYQTVVKIYGVDKTIIDTIENSDCCYAVIKLNNGDFLNLFNVIISETESSFVSQSINIKLLSSDVIAGSEKLSMEDRFQNFSLEITDGVEIMGICPYNLENDLDLFMLKKVDIPIVYDTIEAETILGKFAFSAYPEINFEKNGLWLGFEQRIQVTTISLLSVSDFRATFERISSFFQILCGEIITINRINITVKTSEDKYKEFEFIGFCNFPKQQLDLWEKGGIDTPVFLRQSVFKISDFPDINFTLNTWFENYEKMKLSSAAYSRILLDEDTMICTSNRFLASMQLVEGYISALYDEDEHIKLFKKQKKEIISNENNPETKEFLKKYCNYVGETFRQSLKKFTYEAVKIFHDLNYNQFNEDFDAFIGTIKNERDIYTHSSQRNATKFKDIELLNIATLYKNFYRINLLHRFGLEDDLICRRFACNRRFSEYIRRFFNIKLSIPSDLQGFDEKMRDFS